MYQALPLAMTIAFLANLTLFAGHPPLVIRNKEALVSRVAGLHFKIESTFDPTPTEAIEPSKNLLAYLQKQIQQSKSKYAKDRFSEIIKKIPGYDWFVAGFSSGGRKYLYCYFTDLFSGPSFDYPESDQSFPLIKDGGRSVCFAIFDLTSGQFVLLRSNGVA